MPATDLMHAAGNAVRQFNYVLSARSLKKTGGFGSGVGKPRFLKVPRGVPATPEHEIGPNIWLKEIVDLADGVADDVISPTGDVLVFVHGYNNSAQEIADRHRILQDGPIEQGWRGVVVSYDWPCDDETLNYYEDRADAG